MNTCHMIQYNRGHIYRDALRPYYSTNMCVKFASYFHKNSANSDLNIALFDVNWYK